MEDTHMSPHMMPPRALTSCPRCLLVYMKARIFSTAKGFFTECECGQKIEISAEEFARRGTHSPAPASEMIHQHPRGWWFHYEAALSTWCGPFASAEEAEKIARMLVPDNQKEIELIELQMWAQKVVKQ